MDKVKEYGTFVPGDKILLKRGSVFTGQQLAFQGMEQKEILLKSVLMEKERFQDWKETVR